MSTCDKFTPPRSVGLEAVLIMINKMRSDNYTFLFIYLMLFIALAVIFYYFVSHLVKTLLVYYRNKGTKETTKNQYSSSTDDQSYEEDDVLIEVQDPKQFMDPGKKKFVAELDNTYKDYNRVMDEYMKSKLNKKDNDNTVNAGVLFEKNDNYVYETTD